jgi:hypothetical protein
MTQRTRIMYIEPKGDGVWGPARIGRVTFSKSGSSVYYAGRRFGSLKGNGFKANYFDAETGEHVWISGCKKDGSDALYSTVVEVDEDVREEYWETVRGRPELRGTNSFRSPGKYSK